MSTVASLTPAQRRALECLRDHGPLTPSSFADFMWPDSRTRMSSAGGYGAVAGVGGNLKAGSFLKRLHDMGYTHRTDCNGYYLHGLSYAGGRALRASS